MIYDDKWIPPWTPGLPQARCQGRLCTPDGVPGTLVVAITLVDGLCVNCARTPQVEDAYRLDV